MLGGLGFWCLALVEPIVHSRLLFGQMALRADWAQSATAAVSSVGTMIAHGVPLVALIWALAAWVLPSVTASGRVIVDLCVAVLWAAGLTAASVAVAGALNWPVSLPQTGVLLAGSAVAALLAVVGAGLRPQH